MDTRYYQMYKLRAISYRKLYARITLKYSSQIKDTDGPEALLNYHEVLYLLDQKCPFNQKADRSLTNELFQQAANSNQLANLTSIIHTYIQNLQTAKVCLQRHQQQKITLETQINSLKATAITYVYLQMIQASVFSHFSKSPTFTYQINPSSIAPVTLSNALNPTIDNQFTLVLQDTEQFNITFYDSGIQIYRWWFPDSPGLSQGEYLRSIKTENVKFQIKIKYIPRGKGQEQRRLMNEMNTNEEALRLSQDAFKRLCEFQPFQNGNRSIRTTQSGDRLIDRVVEVFPFVGEYVRNLYMALLVFVIFSSACSFYSSIEFVDIIVAFYAISLLSDLAIESTQISFLILEIVLVLAIIKTIWSTATTPFYYNQGLHQLFTILSIVMKGVLILLVALCIVEDGKVARQKLVYFGSGSGLQSMVGSKLQQDGDIWQRSILDSESI